MLRYALFLLLVTSVASFSRGPLYLYCSSSSTTSLSALKEIASVDEIRSGERKLIESPSGTIIVANLEGAFYAVNAKCPHLNLPMKKGVIEVKYGVPTITCNFHNSVFDLNDGSCKQWCTSVLGIPNSGMFGSIMGSVGRSRNSPATIYPVTVSEGRIYMDI